MLIDAFPDDAEHEDFLIDNKHWLFFRIGSLEFRCSYKLTQMNLYMFTKEMHVQHKKLLGANDYGIHYEHQEPIIQELINRYIKSGKMLNDD